MFVVFDLDGTLALNQHRNHFVEQAKPDWDSYLAACDKDEPNIPLITLYNALLSEKAGLHFANRVEIWTGRSDAVADKTWRWMAQHGLDEPDALMARSFDDFRPDTELKANWMKQFGKPDLVFDDRSTVINMFRSHGVVAAQVAPGNF